MNGLNMRNSKMKIVVYCSVAAGLLLTLYILNSMHSHLKDVKGAYDICQQQKDSLLAQLQVVYEQKNRVEKFLQQEKLDHKKTKEENLQNSEARSQLDKDKSDLENRLNNLQQELQALTSSATQLKEKIVQNDEEIKKMAAENENNLHSKESEISNLKSQLSSLTVEHDQLQQHFDTQHSELSQLKADMQESLYQKNQLQEQLKVKSLNPESSKDNHDDAHHPNKAKDDKLATAAESKQNQDQTNNKGDGLLHGGGAGINPEQFVNPNNPNNVEINNNNNKAEIVNKPVALPQVTSDLSKPVVADPLNEINKNSNNNNENNKEKSKDEMPQLQPPMDKNNKNEQAEINKVPPAVLAKPENHKLVKPENSVQQNEISANNNQGQNKAPLAPPNESQQLGAGQAPLPNMRWETGLKRGPQLKNQAQAPENNVQAAGPPQQAPLNHPGGDEDENYRDDGGDDDAAEEQEGGDDGPFNGGEKAPRERGFQDNDFEDNVEGGDQNHAKEEGVVVAPK